MDFHRKPENAYVCRCVHRNGEPRDFSMVVAGLFVCAFVAVVAFSNKKTKFYVHCSNVILLHRIQSKHSRFFVCVLFSSLSDDDDFINKYDEIINLNK